MINETTLMWVLGGMIVLLIITGYLLALYGDRIDILAEKLEELEEKWNNN